MSDELNQLYRMSENAVHTRDSSLFKQKITPAQVLNLVSCLQDCIRGLRFYAESDWEVKVDRQGYFDPSMWTIEQPQILNDAGECARNILSEIGMVFNLEEQNPAV